VAPDPRVEFCFHIALVADREIGNDLNCLSRFLQLLLAHAAFIGGLWLFYAGYGRGVSLAGKTETGLGYVKTGVDGKTRIPVHRWYYAGGLVLLIGSTWWLVKGGRQPKPRRRR
jgi:hypothetical protein